VVENRRSRRGVAAGGRMARRRLPNRGDAGALEPTALSELGEGKIGPATLELDLSAATCFLSTALAASRMAP